MANDPGVGGNPNPNPSGGDVAPPKRDGLEAGQRVRKDGYVWEWNGTRWTRMRATTAPDRDKYEHARDALDNPLSPPFQDGSHDGERKRKGGQTWVWDEDKGQWEVDVPAEGNGGGGGASGGGGGGGNAGGNAGGGGGGGDDDGGAEADTRTTKEKIRELYPQYAVFLRIPEVGDILRKAAEENWSPERLKGALQKTKWWDNTTQAIRQWETFVENAGDREVRETITRKAQELREFAIREYGAREIKIDDMKKIAERGLRMGWTDAMFAAAIREHHKFDAKSDSEVQFITELIYDKEQLRDRISEMRAHVDIIAGQVGVQLDGQDLQLLSRRAVRFGWTDEQIQRELAGRIEWDDDSLGGDAARTWQEIGRLAAEYLLPLSERTRRKWAQRILSGEDTIDSFVQHAQQMARSQFPSLAGVIDRGITVNEFAEPYREQIAELLEINPEAVDFRKKKFRKVLQGSVNKKGVRVPMSISQAEEYVKNLREWQFTKNAEEEYRSVAQGVMEMFGAAPDDGGGF